MFSDILFYSNLRRSFFKYKGSNFILFSQQHLYGFINISCTFVGFFKAKLNYAYSYVSILLESAAENFKRFGKMRKEAINKLYLPLLRVMTYMLSVYSNKHNLESPTFSQIPQLFINFRKNLKVPLELIHPILPCMFK